MMQQKTGIEMTDASNRSDLISFLYILQWI